MAHSIIDIAIIGAGTAGCMAAKQLSEAGLRCCVIEKSRGLGGRCSRRRVPDIENVDLGASSFSTYDIDSQQLIDYTQHWVKLGYLTEWNFKSASFQPSFPITEQIELCGMPSMNAFHRHLLGDVTCLKQQHVHTLQRTDEVWQLLDGADQLITEATAVIITAPAEQTYSLVGQYTHFATAILEASQSSLPQYVCAISLEHPLETSVDVFQGSHPVFSKAIRANSKPNQKGTKVHQKHDIWVLHSTHEWAQQQHNQDAEIVADKMHHLFCEHFNLSMQPESSKVLTSHYWRLAGHRITTANSSLVNDNASQQPFLWDEGLRLGCCADWLSGGGIIGALNSSQNLSDHIASTLTQEV
ncbi:NAD(P)/FAD-dependent oxidoreductase [Alkalimarinus coralli]|uniref:NAD(P)/FAD-dependent oxidoreductase n=1 Tax=Alkalimarinus coralli TaxID=2935863 RepID=UPI00202B87B8|nr:FAD-dependent oxidoreductase [Alkalimarinus coralli]